MLSGEEAREWLANLGKRQSAATREALRRGKELAERTGRAPLDIAALRRAFGGAPPGVLRYVPRFDGANDEEDVYQAEVAYYVSHPEFRSTDELIRFWIEMEQAGG